MVMNFLQKVLFPSGIVLMIGDDIGHFAERPKPAVPVEKGKFGEFEEQIRVFGKPSTTTAGVTSSVRFVDEHFPAHTVLQENAFLTTESVIKLKLRNTRVVWNLHDGYDWPRTRDVIALAVQKLEQKAADALSAKARRKTPRPTRTVTLPKFFTEKIHMLSTRMKRTILTMIPKLATFSSIRFMLE